MCQNLGFFSRRICYNASLAKELDTKISVGIQEGGLLRVATKNKNSQKL